VEHKGKIYYVGFINSDDEIMLGNRDYWEIMDEEWEEIEDDKLTAKLIKFCIRHFNDYNPNYKKDC